MNVPVWIFPLVQTVHLIAMSLLIGIELTVNGGLLAGRRESEAGLRVPFRAALAASALSGVLMFTAQSDALLAKPALWVKMAALFLALTLVYLWRNPLLARRDISGRSEKFLVFVILMLWLTAAVAGRWIGFS